MLLCEFIGYLDVSTSNCLHLLLYRSVDKIHRSKLLTDSHLLWVLILRNENQCNSRSLVGPKSMIGKIVNFPWLLKENELLCLHRTELDWLHTIGYACTSVCVYLQISLVVSVSTVGASSSVTRRVLAEIVYVIYNEVWAVFILEYKLKG